MDLDHSFTVSASAQEAWRALTDVARVARCMPGAALDEGSADPYTGTVKIKVGAVAVKFRGELDFADVDESSHSLQLDCRGKDVRGASGASASIRMALVEQSADRTEVRVTTNLQLSGKIAQFGRGMLQDVSNAILQRFVSNLERDLRGETSGGAAAPDPQDSTAEKPSHSVGPTVSGRSEGPSTTTAASPGTAASPAASATDDDMIDLGATVLPVMLKRYGTTALSAIAALLALWALVRTFGRGRSGSDGHGPHFETPARPPLLVIHRWSKPTH